MANQTLAEATYTKTIIDKKETAERLILAHLNAADDIMAKLNALHTTVEDAKSKTEVLAIRSQWRLDLQTKTTI